MNKKFLLSAILTLCFIANANAIDEREGFVRQLAGSGDVFTVPNGKRFVLLQVFNQDYLGRWELQVDGKAILDYRIFGFNDEASPTMVGFPDRCVVVEPGETLYLVTLYGKWANITLIGYFYNFHCGSYPLSDLNKDCKVDMGDLAILAGEWMKDNTA